MEKLTRAEEEIMQIIWEIGPCTVGDIRDYYVEKLGQKKPPHSTISTMVRILDDKKGILRHEAFGRTFVYHPVVSKEDYRASSLHKLVEDYFGGSPNQLVSHLLKAQDLSLGELQDLMDRLDEKEDKS